MKKVRVDEIYEIVIDFNNNRFECLRQGEKWRDLTGDNLILAMAHRIQKLEMDWLDYAMKAQSFMLNDENREFMYSIFKEIEEDKI